MHIRNSDRVLEPFDPKKIHDMLVTTSTALAIAPCELADLYDKILSGLCDNLTTTDLMNMSTECAASLMTRNPEFGVLAVRLAVREHHKQTVDGFYEKVKFCYEQGRFFTREFFERVKRHRRAIQDEIDYGRDYELSFFGFRTMQRSYMLTVDGRVVERPQDLFMRVALGIHYDSIEDAFETYRLFASRHFTHATPTMFNAGTGLPQLSSCFLLGIEEDSIEGIFREVTNSALISKCAGGLGLHMNKLRAANSLLRSSGGRSCGIVPVIKILESTLRCIDQGGKKRQGSMAVYLEPWHADIFGFLDLRKNTGAEELRARGVFTALWIPDLFMKRVQNDETWSLFSADDVAGLEELHGDAFERRYVLCEKNGLARRTVKAQKLWKAILSSQIETGTPYMCYKDSANAKNMQMNLGTLKCSNLCAEIMEYTDENEISVCNLASLGLPMFLTRRRCSSSDSGMSSGSGGGNSSENVSCNGVSSGSGGNGTKCMNCANCMNGTNCMNNSANINNSIGTTINDSTTANANTDDELFFDFNKLIYATKVLVRNLNKIIDINYYPVPQTRVSNLKHRPIGVGVQGLADVFVLLKLPFDSPGARDLNRRIFETIYFAALDASNELARAHGPYESYAGSPVSRGVLSFDLWNVRPVCGHDWAALRRRIKAHGVRNSLLVALMPTASTSQMLGFNECFEPFLTNFYTRRTLAGEFQVVNAHLVRDLKALGLWSDEMKNQIINSEGSVQGIRGIPQDVKDLYKTAWELKMRTLIDMAADRAPFVDQSQSLNIFMAEPTYPKLTSMHFYGWKKGLKTGMYYLRTRPISKAVKVTVDKEMLRKSEGEEDCLSCGA